MITKERKSDDMVLRELYAEGFRISAQEIKKTTMNRPNSKITIIVEGL